MQGRNMQEQYDNAFLGILQHEGTIFNFLDAIFSFLYRKTDFYLLMKDKREKLGFPPGQALKILVNAFRKYEAAAKHDTERRLKKQQQAAAANAAAATTAMTLTTVAPVTAAAATVAITTAAATTAMTATTTGCAETTVIAAATTTGTATAATTVTAAVADQPQLKDVDTDNMRSPSGSTVHGASCPDSDTGSCTEQKTQTNGMNDMNKDDTDLVTEESVAPADESGMAVGGDSGMSGRSVDSGQCPDAMEVGEGDILKPEQHKSNSKKGEDSGENLELKRLQATFQANPESYNGAMRDNYSWSQSISDVDVRIEVPKHIKKGRDVRVDIQRKHLRMTYRDASGEWVIAVNGDLTWDINKEECVWTLVPQEHVHVNLEKVQERWWEAVLVSEPTINVRNIDPSRPMSDLDDEAQAKIQEMMFNERQKQLGLPTSDDQKMQEMLKKAWDAEGSPFRGQPFDPSKINLSGSNSLEING